MTDLAQRLLAMAAESGLSVKRCLGHEQPGQPHVVVSRDTCHSPCCFHVSAVDRLGREAVQSLATELGMELFETALRQPTLQACAPWTAVQR